MTDDLVDRLRSADRKARILMDVLALIGSNRTTLHRLAETSKTAADCIEALTAERDAAVARAEKAKAEAERLRDENDRMRYIIATSDLSKMQKLVEAGKELLSINDEYALFGGEIYQDRIDRAWDALRFTLAAIAKEQTK